jgi:hypothetical protein
MINRNGWFGWGSAKFDWISDDKCAGTKYVHSPPALDAPSCAHQRSPLAPHLIREGQDGIGRETKGKNESGRVRGIKRDGEERRTAK